jgi:L,D-transpeptidase ErfK/SrfK
MMHKVISFLLTMAISGHAQAGSFILPPADVDIVGLVTSVTAGRDNTLLDIAREYDIGQNEILHANPDVDRWLPADNSAVTLPNRFILPGTKRTGLVINLPEMRLYYYPKPKAGEPPVVITHPVSVGRMDWETPLGITKIISKKKDPSWRPPQSLKDEAIAEGEDPLPDIVEAGPDNPLGRYAMRLGIPGYLIHSTNKPYGVGMRVTHGCLRMYPEDIESLFEVIPVNTPVQLINQPIKLGWLAGSLFLELHPPLEEDREQYQDYMQSVLNAISDFLADENNTADVAAGDVGLSGSALRQAVEEKSGMPVLISR